MYFSRKEGDSNPRYLVGTHPFQGCTLNRSDIFPNSNKTVSQKEKKFNKTKKIYTKIHSIHVNQLKTAKKITFRKLKTSIRDKHITIRAVPSTPLAQQAERRVGLSAVPAFAFIPVRIDAALSIRTGTACGSRSNPYRRKTDSSLQVSVGTPRTMNSIL